MRPLFTEAPRVYFEDTIICEDERHETCKRLLKAAEEHHNAAPQYAPQDGQPVLAQYVALNASADAYLRAIHIIAETAHKKREGFVFQAGENDNASS